MQIDRREFLMKISATAGFAVLKQSFGMPGKGFSKKKPNIVLFLCDDMGFSDLGCYGGEIQTPNIDSLAEQGLRFTQFYNCARCIPTRASLLTGLYPQQVGVDSSGGYSKVMPNCVTLAEVLKSAGYRTLMTGKWHGPEMPVKRGFDRYYGLASGCCNYFNPGLKRPEEPEPGRKRPGERRPWAINEQLIQPYTPEDKDFYATDAFTDKALQYLDQYGKGEQPFFLYVAYTAPHFPIQAPWEDIDKYRGKYKVGWDVIRQRRYERMAEKGLIEKHWKLSPRDPRAPKWEEIEDKDAWDLKMAVYAAMIDRMDQNIGLILEKIRKLGKEQNTLVLFLSDNGACAEDVNRTPDIPPGPMESYRSVDLPWANASDTPFRKFKMYTYEGGFATPLIAKWPEVIKEQGSISHQVGHVIDIMLTLCEVAGVAYPQTYKGQSVQSCEGKSLVPIFEGKTRQSHKGLYWKDMGNKAIREGKWKLVASSDPEGYALYGTLNGSESKQSNDYHWELYDLEEDRTETNDLSGQFPERAKHMLDVWHEWDKSTRCSD